MGVPVPPPEPERPQPAGWLPTWILDPYAVPAAVAGIATTLEGALRLAANTLLGQRIRLPGTDLRLKLTGLTLDPEVVGLAVGQLGRLRLEATDIEWNEWSGQRLVVVANNVHVRPLPPVAVAAPVTVELALAPADVARWVADVQPQVRLEVGADSRPLLRWAQHPHWGAVAVTIAVTEDAILLRPDELRAGRSGRRIGLPVWVPTVQLPLPRFPRNLHLRSVQTSPTEIVLHFVADEWAEELPGHRFVALLALP